LNAYGFRNEERILAVRSIPVASVENPDRLIVKGGQRLEEADETTLVIELDFVSGD
jgi:hypothetical protein